MADNVMQSTTLTLPTDLVNEIWTGVQEEAILPRLSGAEAQKFGKSEIMVLKGTPKAEIVGEGDAKSGQVLTYETKEVIPVKLHTGVRVSQELIWGDEQRQRIIMTDIAKHIRKSLVDALDTIGFKGVNPKTGSKASQIKESIFDTVLEVECEEGSEDHAIDEAYLAIIDNDYAPNGIAASRKFDTQFKMVYDLNGYKKYPAGVDGFDGLKAAVGVLDDEKEVLAVVGDFSAFKWGVQEEIPLEVIPYGNPDNQEPYRDLAGHNEVFVRAEVVYGIGIMDLNAFAKVKKAD